VLALYWTEELSTVDTFDVLVQRAAGSADEVDDALLEPVTFLTDDMPA
jgi:hypothetical protein